ncbi:class I SAM-dependent methyltransferase [Patescibacteria group bacterium]|nr:class I SAM-dependent methyltransferase [Patescibacteria group bacterium]
MTSKLEDNFAKTLPQKKEFVNPLDVIKQTHLGPNMIVADLGCGSGYLSFAAAKIINPEGLVYAVDIRTEAISSIESQKRLFGERNIKTLRADLSEKKSTGLSSGSVDLVILATIVFQLPDKKSLFEEAKRIVKDKGEIVILDWKKKDSPIGPPVRERISQKSMERLLTEENLVVTRNIVSDPYHYGFLTHKG